MTLLDPHLDIDQLSAAVDGTRDPAVAAHLLACLACRQQVDTWRRTLAPLRTLPAPPLDVDPVLAAMAAWSPALWDEVGAESSGATSVPSGAEPPGTVPLRRRPRNARLRRLQPPAGVAAALVAVVLAAAAVIGIRAGGSGVSGAGSKSSAGAAVAQRGAASAASTPAPLASGAAPTSRSAAAPAVAPASSSGRATGAVPAYAGTTQLAAELRHVVSSRPEASVRAATPCLHQARLDAAEVPAVATTSPTFTEAVTLVGVPGQVFVFALTHGHVAVVVRSGTCSLLATVSF